MFERPKEGVVEVSKGIINIIMDDASIRPTVAVFYVEDDKQKISVHSD